MRANRTVASLLVLAFSLLAAALATTSAAAAPVGELGRLGEREEQGTSSEGAVGLLAGVSKAAGEESEVNYALGVDPAEGNAVFVLDEAQAPKGMQKGKKEQFTFERHMRIQRFEPSTGKETGVVTFTVTSPVIEEEEAIKEDEYVSNIAVDPAKGELYVLVSEPRKETAKQDVEATSAYELLAFKTAPSGGKLVPAEHAGAGGVLVGPEALGFESNKAGDALIEPHGIAVDPKTHEVVILGYEDSAGTEFDRAENNRTVLERVSEAGSVGARWTDSSDWFGTHDEHGSEPSSPVVTPGGKILVRFEGIAEVPYSFSGSPTQVQPTLPPGNERSYLKEGPESENGGALSLAPEESGTALMYEPAVVYVGKYQGEEQFAIDARSLAKNDQVVGWTGGQSPLVKTADQCVLQPGANGEPMLIAAGSEGKVFVFDPEYLTKPEPDFSPATSKAVIELGPNGKECPTAKSSAVQVFVNKLPLSEGEPVSDTTPVELSLEVTQADAVGQEWTIENKKTHQKSTAGNPLAFREEAVTKFPVLYQPLADYSFSEPGEYLISAKISTDDLATPEVTTPAQRTLVVDAPPIVTEAPVSQTDPVGGQATFSAEASGAPTPSAQWEVSKNSGAKWEELSGQTSTVLVLKSLTGEQSGYEYRARFTNHIGSEEHKVETAGATLTVSSSEAAPVVTLQPKSQTVSEGQPVAFTAAASGVPAPTVQWMVSKNSGTSWEEISGATTTELKLPATAKSESGYEYRAKFKNTKASAETNTAALTVSGTVSQPPAGTISPKTKSANEGENVTFTLTITAGSPPPNVQWEVKTGAAWSEVGGQTGTTLTLAGVTVSNSGEYRAKLENGVGSAVETEPASLTVREKEHSIVKVSTGPSTTTTTTTTTTPTTPEQTKPPAPTATLASTVATVSSAGAWSLKVDCPTSGTHCAGKLVVKTLAAVAVGPAKKGKKPKKQILTLSSGPFSISGGASGTLALHLSSEGKALLAHSHTLQVRAIVEVSGGHTVQKTVTLHLA